MPHDCAFSLHRMFSAGHLKSLKWYYFQLNYTALLHLIQVFFRPESVQAFLSSRHGFLIGGISIVIRKTAELKTLAAGCRECRPLHAGLDRACTRRGEGTPPYAPNRNACVRASSDAESANAPGAVRKGSLPVSDCQKSQVCHCDVVAVGGSAALRIRPLRSPVGPVRGRGNLAE